MRHRIGVTLAPDPNSTLHWGCTRENDTLVPHIPLCENWVSASCRLHLKRNPAYLFLGFFFFVLKHSHLCHCALYSLKHFKSTLAYCSHETMFVTESLLTWRFAWLLTAEGLLSLALVLMYDLLLTYVFAELPLYMGSRQPGSLINVYVSSGALKFRQTRTCLGYDL